MTETTFVYPYDPTGTAVSNYVNNESHTITPVNGDDYRIILPDKAPFYDTLNLVVLHKETGTLLTKGVHYELGYIYRDLSLWLEKSIYGGIVIIDDTLSGTFVISYQTVGGEFTQATTDMTLTAAQLLINPRQLTLEDIVDMPTELPPLDHGHDGMTEIVGMDDVVTALNNITTVLSGNPAIAHKHAIADVIGLTDELFHAAKSNRSHKTALTAGFRLINHTGSATVTMPRFEVATRVRMKIALLGATDNTELTVVGVVGGKDVAAYEVDWISGSCFMSQETEGFADLVEVSFSYDISKNPTVYIGKNNTFTDVFVTIKELTIDNASPELYIDGYSCGQSAIMVGTPGTLQHLGTN